MKGEILHTNMLRQQTMTWIIAGLLLLEGGTMYNTIVGSPLKTGIIKTLLILTCLFDVIINSNSIKKRSIYACMFLVPYFAIYYITTRYNFRPFLLYALMLIALFIYVNESVNDKRIQLLINAFSNLVLLMAAVSLFFWFFGSIMHIIPAKPVQYYWGRDYPYTSYNYFYLYFENPIQASGSIIRNTGIYTEAPGYVTKLLIALCIEFYYYSKQKRFIRKAILMAALVSTLSSKGAILLIYLLAVRWFFYSKLKYKMNKVIHVGFVLIAAMVAFVMLSWITRSEMSTESSSMTRIDHLYSGIVTWLQNPIFGVGFNNEAAISKNHMYSGTPEGASMGIATFLAEGGIYSFGLYMGSIICALRRGKRIKRHKDMLFCVGALLIEWFISNIGYSAIAVILVCMGYCVRSRGIVPFNRMTFVIAGRGVNLKEADV